jgi:signal transduction histidine kinase
MKNLAQHILWLLRYLLGWVPFFLLNVLALYVNNHGPLSAVVYQTTFYYLPGIVLGLGVWWFVGKTSMQRHNWGKLFVIHLLAGAVFSLSWHVLFFCALYLAGGLSVLQQFLFYQLFWMLMIGLLIYGVIAGMCAVDRLVKQVRERELNAVKAEGLRVRAEMEALRGQLDPHFLFNTLHSITALVREDALRAEEALLQFGDLLRHVIASKRDGADEVPLSEELAFIDKYLALEKLRLGERLGVEQNCDAAAKHCWIPTFTVQPLVENAIRHGIARRREGGTLKLSALIRENHLEITVEDNGPGTEPATVIKSSGVGLGAIRQRLKLRHGDAATLTVDTAPGRGFRVAISLPAVHNAIVDSVA